MSHLDSCVLRRSHSKGAYVIEAVSFQKSKQDTLNATFFHRNSDDVLLCYFTFYYVIHSI